MRNIEIIGTVDLDAYNGIESVYSIIEELAVISVNGICFSVHADAKPGVKPFTLSEWLGIKRYCDALNVEFIGRPRALCAIELLEKIGVKRYRISAEEICNFPLLEKLAITGKDLILSSPTGMDWQIERLIDFIHPFVNDIVIMQWMPSYGCEPCDWGLTRIEWLRNHYGYHVGLYDRSGDVFASIAALALGADVIEFKVSDCNDDLRKRLVTGIRKVEQSLMLHPDADYNLRLAYKGMFERSLIINKDKMKGSKISLDDIEIIDDCSGIDISRYEDVIGKYINQDLKKGDLLNWKLLQSNEI